MKAWKYLLWVGLGIFVVTRLLSLMSFPMSNDEAIYLQYSQAIHEDFGKYKFISEGGVFADWKPPLQYWIGAIFFGFTDDPLTAGRVAVFIVSLFGLWGWYLFVKEFLGKKEAALAVLIYALCPSALFYNNQFVAETFVFSLTPWLYWSLLKALRPDKLRWWYFIPSVLFGAALILSKQSGMLYLILATLLPVAMLDHKQGHNSRMKDWDWKGFFLRISLVLGVILLAKITSLIGVTSAAGQVQKNFDSNWLMSFSQVLALPTKIWLVNWESIRDHYRYQYSLFILIPLLYFFLLTLWRRNLKNIVLGLGFIGASLAILLFLKGFNQYIYNTATIVFLIPILAVALLSAITTVKDPSSNKPWRAAAALTLLSLILLFGHWCYQIGFMKVSPAGYIRRSSPWIVANYLDNWSGGFGVAETIAYLEKASAPGIVLADPQWGNPRTALEVYNPKYPRVRIIGMTGDFRTREGTLAARALILEHPFVTRLAIFSSARNESRAVWQDNIEKYMCDKREEIKVTEGQPPIIICSF